MIIELVRKIMVNNIPVGIRATSKNIQKFSTKNANFAKWRGVTAKACSILCGIVDLSTFVY